MNVVNGLLGNHAHSLFRIFVVITVYGLFASLFWPFKKAILFAILFAFALNPVLSLFLKWKSKIKKLDKWSDQWVVLGLVNSVVGLFFIPLLLIILSGVSTLKNLRQSGMQNSAFFTNIESAITRVMDSVQSTLHSYGVSLSEQVNLREKAIEVGERVFAFMTGLVTQLPWFLFQFIVFCVTLYFILVRRHELKNWFINLKILNQEQIERFSNVFEGTCYLVLVSSVLVATAQALIVSFACLIAGYDDFLIIFLIAFFMSFIPVIGSAPLTISLILHSVFQMHWGAAIVLVVAASLAGVADNVIRTVMMSQKDGGTHPVIALLSLIGAMSLFGFLGLFIGPIVTELAFKVSKIVFHSDVTEGFVTSESDLPHRH